MYRPLIPYAARHNLRLVLLNMHGYPESTTYSDAELDRLEGTPMEQELALKIRGVELAVFLRWFIEMEHIPPVTEVEGSRKIGGVSVLAWSGGNSVSLAMFAHAHALPQDTQKLLGAYLRTLILYGA